MVGIRVVRNLAWPTGQLLGTGPVPVDCRVPSFDFLAESLKCYVDIPIFCARKKILGNFADGSTVQATTYLIIQIINKYRYEIFISIFEMLTDCPSQFEMKGVNNIPKSFQKLINEIQNVKQNKKQSKSKSTSLDIKTVSKNTKNATTIKKKRTPKQSKPVETALEENDESNVAENFVQIPNQTNITEFFNTARSNSSNRRTNKNPEKAGKQEVPNIDVDILSSDSDDFLYSNQNPRPTTDFKEQDFSLSEFQNPDYLSFLSDRNQSCNPINEANGFGNATESNLKGKKLHYDQTKDTNWKTFNEMNDDMDCDFIIERKKNIAPNIFYSHNKTNEKIPSRIGKNITNKSRSSIKKNSDSDVIRQQNVSNDAEKKLLNLLRDDREKMTALLNQVKSMSDSVTKARQGISKFFANRNN